MSNAQFWLGQPCEKRNDFEAQASRIVLDALDTDRKDPDRRPTPFKHEVGELIE